MPLTWKDWWDPPNPGTRAGDIRVRQYLEWLNGLEVMADMQLSSPNDLGDGEVLADVVEALAGDCDIPRGENRCHGPRKSVDGVDLTPEMALLEDAIMVVWERGGAPPPHAPEDYYSIADIKHRRPGAIATLLHGMFKAFLLSEVIPQLMDMLLWYNKVLAPYFKELRRTAALLIESTVGDGVTSTSVLEALKGELVDCSAWICCFHTHCRPAYMLDLGTVYWSPDPHDPSQLLANAGFCFSVFETYEIKPQYTLREYVRYPHSEFICLQAYVIWKVLKEYPCLAEVSARALNFLDQSVFLRTARLCEERRVAAAAAAAKPKRQLPPSSPPHAGYIEMLRRSPSRSPSPKSVRRRKQPPPSEQKVIPSPFETTTLSDLAASPPAERQNQQQLPDATKRVTQMLQVMLETHKEQLLRMPISERSRAIVQTAGQQRKSKSERGGQVAGAGPPPRWRGSNEKVYSKRELRTIESMRRARKSVPAPRAPRSASAVSTGARKVVGCLRSKSASSAPQGRSSSSASAQGAGKPAVSFTSSSASSPAPTKRPRQQQIKASAPVAAASTTTTSVAPSTTAASPSPQSALQDQEESKSFSYQERSSASFSSYISSGMPQAPLATSPRKGGSSPSFAVIEEAIQELMQEPIAMSVSPRTSPRPPRGDRISPPPPDVPGRGHPPTSLAHPWPAVAAADEAAAKAPRMRAPPTAPVSPRTETRYLRDTFSSGAKRTCTSPQAPARAARMQYQPQQPDQRPTQEYQQQLHKQQNQQQGRHAQKQYQPHQQSKQQPMQARQEYQHQQGCQQSHQQAHHSGASVSTAASSSHLSGAAVLSGDLPDSYQGIAVRQQILRAVSYSGVPKPAHPVPEPSLTDAEPPPAAAHAPPSPPQPPSHPEVLDSAVQCNAMPSVAESGVQCGPAESVVQKTETSSKAVGTSQLTRSGLQAYEGMLMPSKTPEWGHEEALLVADLDSVRRKWSERHTVREGSPSSVLQFFNEDGVLAVDQLRQASSSLFGIESSVPQLSPKASPQLVVSEEAEEEDSSPEPRQASCVFKPGTTLLELFESCIEQKQLPRPARAPPPPPRAL